MTKILLVEDDKSLREIYGVRLLAEGYDIVSAGDGEEALAMAIKERPQLIVSDVMMPKISGFDMLDILRSTTETKDIKVIMMTALSSEDQRARGEALGADRYLVKSQVGIEDVVRTVHEVLQDVPLKSVTPAQAFTSGAPLSTPVGSRPAAPAVPARPTQAPPQTQTPPTPNTPTPAPAAPQQPPQPAASLPQPTAPFSTPRPANLGDRVIHPISEPQEKKEDIGSLMEKELNEATPMATPPVPAPSAAPAPQPPSPQAPPVPTPPPAATSTPQPTTTGLPQPPTPPIPSLSPSPAAPPPQMPADGNPHGAIAFEETPRTPTPPAPGV